MPSLVVLYLPTYSVSVHLLITSNSQVTFSGHRRWRESTAQQQASIPNPRVWTMDPYSRVRTFPFFPSSAIGTGVCC
ncbi:hypothetical protein V8F20_008618 [Naviculisporaceae sp. PSN 640]